jgi:hypothetical protein
MWRDLAERLFILALLVVAGAGLVYAGIAVYILRDIGLI